MSNEGDWRAYDGEPNEPYAIMFHHFHQDHEKPYGQGSINASELQQMIEYIESKKKNRVLNAKSFAELYMKKELKPWHVCLTFDDNLACQFNVAGPVLERLNLTGFFFVYTCIYDDILEQLESYKYFQGISYENLDVFYETFFSKVQDLFGTAKNINSRIESAECKSFRAHVPFYTVNDRKFRYLRDVVLGKHDFQSVILAMMQEKQFDPKKYSSKIWMTKSMLKNLHENGHIVGLHSYSHHTTINNICKDEQQIEYETNKAGIAELFTPAVWAMSHPLGHYNDDTSTVLEELGIDMGFTTKPSHGTTRYEIPRIDHAFIMKKMQACEKGSEGK